MGSLFSLSDVFIIFSPARLPLRPLPRPAGKDADFLVFDNDLLTAEHEGISYNLPQDVYFGGRKVN